MALSRIWSAFIIIAVLVGSYKLLFREDNKSIFSTMVVGKTGDTIRIDSKDSSVVSKDILRSLDTNKVYTSGDIKLTKTGDGRLMSFKIQSADGVIETCKAAVNLCIGLIGIMALFMGFMSIAERAGGIRFLSRLIGPFFSKIFPGIPKGHPAMGHMMMNFSANLLGLDNAATPFGIKAM